MHRIGSEARKYSGYRELNYAICCLVVLGILYKNRLKIIIIIIIILVKLFGAFLYNIKINFCIV